MLTGLDSWLPRNKTISSGYKTLKAKRRVITSMEYGPLKMRGYMKIVIPKTLNWIPVNIVTEKNISLLGWKTVEVKNCKQILKIYFCLKTRFESNKELTSNCPWMSPTTMTGVLTEIKMNESSLEYKWKGMKRTFNHDGLNPKCFSGTITKFMEFFFRE